MDPFTDQEKRVVLAEMIKTSQIEIHSLVRFINDYGIQPDWHEMQLPFRRTVNQCQQAAKVVGVESPSHPSLQHLQHAHQVGPQHPTQQRQQHQQHQQYQQYQGTRSPSHSLSAKRKSSGDSGEHISKRVATEIPETHTASHLRPLQPRTSANGAFGTPSGSSVASPPARDKPKKRGRPSRAEKDALARASASQSTPYMALASKPVSLSEPATPGPPESSARAIPTDHDLSRTQLASNESREEIKNYGPLDRSPSSERGPPTVSEEARSTPSTHERPPLSSISQENPSEPHPTSKHNLATAANPSPKPRVAVADLLKKEPPASMTTRV